MEKIHISRARQNLGDYSPEEIRTGLANGRFFPTDLAWKEGMEGWQPLSSFAEFQSASPPLGEPFMSEPDTLPPAVSASGEVEPAWERRAERSFLGALIETIKDVLNAPSNTFTRMPKTGGLGNPFLFFFVTSWFSTGVALFFQCILYALNPEELFKVFQMEFPLWYIFAFGAAYALFFIPLFLAIGIFISTAITHICLMLVGGAKQSYETTFRTLCYAYGGTSVFYMIPWCGWFIGLIWSVVTTTIGLSKAHKVSVWRSLTAVLLPYVFFCLCFMAFIAVIINMAGGLDEFIKAYSAAAASR
ncbi:MAG: YIP1 family protein [Chthoniobacterales bacterium]